MKPRYFLLLEELVYMYVTAQNHNNSIKLTQIWMVQLIKLERSFCYVNMVNIYIDFTSFSWYGQLLIQKDFS